MTKTRTLAFLLSIMAMITFALPAQAQTKEAYVVRSTDGQTITFFYDKQKAAHTAEGAVWGILEKKGEEGDDSPIWAGSYSDTEQTLTKAVFDASFRDYRPTNTRHWFRYCARLHIIEGLENLNTENVTDMREMFANCYELSSLDLSGFNTENVINMRGMFRECEVLTALDLSTFNTANVTDMSDMFLGCTALSTIYCNDDWNHGVIKSDDMFQDNTKLKGAVAYDAAKTGVEMTNPTTGYFTKKDNTAIPQASITEDTAARAIYTTDGKQTKRIQTGLNILRMNDGTTRKIVKKQ